MFFSSMYIRTPDAYYESRAIYLIWSFVILLMSADFVINHALKDRKVVILYTIGVIFQITQVYIVGMDWSEDLFNQFLFVPFMLCSAFLLPFLLYVVRHGK